MSINKIAHKGIIFSLYYIAVSFILPLQISNIGVAFLVLCWIIERLSSNENLRDSFTKQKSNLISWGFIAFYFWQVLSLLHTNNLDYGLKIIEYKLSLFVLPVVFLSIRIERERLIGLLKAYTTSIAICSIFLLVNSLYSYKLNEGLLFYENFTAIIQLHAVFFSYYIFLALLIVFYLFKNLKLKKLEKYFFGFSVMAFVISLVFLASKNVIIAIFLFSVCYLILRLSNQKLNLKEALSMLLVAIALVSLSYSLPVVQQRINEVGSLEGISNIQKIKKGEKLQNEDRTKFNGTSLRLSLWYLGVSEVFRQDNILLGLSSGDFRNDMNAVYDKVGLYPWFRNYNMHNQFVQIFVELGLIGLIVYLSIYLIAIQISFKSKNYLLLAFLIGLILFQLTESILERNKGIVFVVFFFLILSKLKKSHENRDTGN